MAKTSPTNEQGGGSLELIIGEWAPRQLQTFQVKWSVSAFLSLLFFFHVLMIIIVIRTFSSAPFQWKHVSCKPPLPILPAPSPFIGHRSFSLSSDQTDAPPEATLFVVYFHTGPTKCINQRQIPFLDTHTHTHWKLTEKEGATIWKRQAPRTVQQLTLCFHCAACNLFAL